MKMIDYIRSSFKDILDIERKLNTLEDEMSTHYDEKIVSKYNDLYLDMNIWVVINIRRR